MTDINDFKIKLFCVSAMLSKYEIKLSNTQIVNKLLCGYKYSISEDSALGSYVKDIQKDYSQWLIVNVVILEIEKGSILVNLDV